MPKFNIELSHSLPADDVRSRLERATAKLERDYGARCTWHGGRELRVARTGLDARLVIEDARLRIDVTLGFLLSPLAGAIRNGITQQLTFVLSAPAPSARPPGEKVS